MTDTSRQIWLVVDEPEIRTGQKGIFADSVNFVRKEVQLDTGKMQASLAKLCQTVGVMLEHVSLSGAGYQLDSFEITAEIGAEGEVKLIGGIKGTVSGGVTLKFARTKE